MAGIKQDLLQTMTRKEIMKARDNDAEEIRSGKIKTKPASRRIVKGTNLA